MVFSCFMVNTYSIIVTNFSLSAIVIRQISNRSDSRESGESSYGSTKHHKNNTSRSTIIFPMLSEKPLLSPPIPHHNHVVVGCSTHAESPLELHVPRSLFDALCARLGNAYKAECWAVARYSEVDTLSSQSIESYVNIMACDRLGLERGSNNNNPRITVHPLQQPPEFNAKGQPA